MKTLCIFTYFLIFTSNEVFAKKFALVVSGAAKSYGTVGVIPENFENEFSINTVMIGHALKERGYETIVLHDAIGIKGQKKIEASSEIDDKLSLGFGSKISGLLPGNDRTQQLRTSMSETYRYLEDNFGAQSATEERLLSSLKYISDNAKSGDDVEIHFKVHGYRFCDGKDDGINPTVLENKPDNCEHQIALNDPQTGEISYVATSKIMPYLKKLDNNNVKTNFIMTSCFSGALEEDLATLKNTCSLMGSSGNNVAFSCFDSDKEGDLSYTSVGDMISYSYVTEKSKEHFLNSPFKNSSCFKKWDKHYRDNELTNHNRSIDSLFWASRKKDSMQHQPFLSVYSASGYFSRDQVASSIVNKSREYRACSYNVLTYLGITSAEIISDDVLKVMVANFEDTIAAYNQNIETQARLIKANGDISKIVELQNQAQLLANKIMDVERELVGFARARGHFDRNGEFNPCKRSIK